MFTVETRTITDRVTAVGSAGPFTLVIDRPEADGGGGRGFNGGQLLYLAVAACVSNDLFREAAAAGIRLTTVSTTVDGDFEGNPAVSSAVIYSVQIAGDADADALRDLVRRVDEVAEIPNSLRRGTAVALGNVTVL